MNSGELVVRLRCEIVEVDVAGARVEVKPAATLWRPNEVSEMASIDRVLAALRNGQSCDERHGAACESARAGAVEAYCPACLRLEAARLLEIYDNEVDRLLEAPSPSSTPRPRP